MKPGSFWCVKARTDVSGTVKLSFAKPSLISPGLGETQCQGPAHRAGDHRRLGESHQDQQHQISRTRGTGPDEQEQSRHGSRCGQPQLRRGRHGRPVSRHPA